MVRQGPQLADSEVPSNELWHRADVAGLSSSGARTLYDIAVVTTPMGGDARLETNRVEVAKFAAYGASHADTYNMFGDRVQPVVFHATAGLGHTAQSFCWQIAGRRMEKETRESTGLGTHHHRSRIQCFFALCGQALRILRRGNTEC